MLGDAIEYPARGEDAPTTILVGGLLPLLALSLAVIGAALSVVAVGLAVLPLAAVPVIALCGYYVAVLRATTAVRTEREPEPPRFRDWRGLFADGLRFIGITVAYAAPAMAFLSVFLSLIAVAGSVTTRLAAAAVTLGAVLSGGLALVAGAGYAYLRPLALANFAREGRLRAAFDVATLRRIGVSRGYAVAWVVALAVQLVGDALEWSLAIVLIGSFLGFYADVARYYLYGRGVAAALGEATPSDRTEDSAADSAAAGAERSVQAGVIPAIEEPGTFAERTRAPDRERGWPDWESERDGHR